MAQQFSCPCPACPGNKFHVIQPAESPAVYQGIGDYAVRTTGAGSDAIASFAARARSLAAAGKEQVQARRDEYLERLSTEVATSDTARQLLNLLI